MTLPKTQACLLALCMVLNAAAQDSTKKTNRVRLNHVGIAFSTMHTAMPFASFSKLFYQDIHPGFELSTGLKWSERKYHDWIQTFNFGYTYQRWVQHTIVLYTELGYRYKLPLGFSTDIKLGAGYMRAIVAEEVFSDGHGDEKLYGKITSGRSQAMGSLSIGMGKSLTKSKTSPRIFLEYQQRFQMPFIHSYVPLLPFNVLKIGVNIPLFK